MTLAEVWDGELASTNIEQGESAPADIASGSDCLAPFYDRQYDIGAKVAVTADLHVAHDAVQKERRLADTKAITNIFAVVGTQQMLLAEWLGRAADITTFRSANVVLERWIVGEAPTRHRDIATSRTLQVKMAKPAAVAVEMAVV